MVIVIVLNIIAISINYFSKFCNGNGNGIMVMVMVILLPVSVCYRDVNISYNNCQFFAK
jgi:hypothetical protein